MLDTVRSMHSLLVLLLAMETSRTTQTSQAVARWPSSEIIRTIRGCRLLNSELLIVQLLFDCGVYLNKFREVFMLKSWNLPVRSTHASSYKAHGQLKNFRYEASHNNSGNCLNLIENQNELIKVQRPRVGAERWRMEVRTRIKDQSRESEDRDEETKNWDAESDDQDQVLRCSIDQSGETMDQGPEIEVERQRLRLRIDYFFPVKFLSTTAFHMVASVRNMAAYFILNK